MKLNQLYTVINEVQREPVQPAEVELLKLKTKALNTRRPWIYKLSILTAQARMKFRVAVYKNRDLLDLLEKPKWKRSREKWLAKPIPDRNVRDFLEGVDSFLQQEIEKHLKGQVKAEVRGAELFLERMRRSFRRRIEAEMAPDLFDQPKKFGVFWEETSIDEKLKKDVPPEILEIQERLKRLGYKF
jgi:hypothetical protein